MNIQNRFFIGVLPHSEMAKIHDVIVGGIDDQRPLSTKNKIVVKLPIGDTADHPCLNSFTEYNHEGVLIELEKDEWK